jgi:hypothetical protein
MRLNKQVLLLLALVAVLLLAHQVFSEPALATLIVVLLTFLIAGLMPSSNQNLRVVFAFAFVTVGFFAYLAVRGILVSNPINSFDLPGSVILIALVAFLITFLLSSDRKIVFQPLSTHLLGGSAALVVCVAFVTHLHIKGQGYFLAWAGSGDSRNHVQWAFSIARDGGISTETLLFPQLTTALSVMLASGNSTNLFNDSSFRLAVDLTSSAMTWVILIGILGFAFAATWEEILSKSKMTKANKSWILVPISLTATSSFALGTYMRDGFISAVTASIAIAFTVAFVLDRTKLSPNQQIFTLLLVFSFSVLGWTLLAIPVALLLIPRYFTWVTSEGTKSKAIVKLLFTSALVFLGTYVFLADILDELKTTLLLPGSITPLDQNLFILILLNLLVLALLSSPKSAQSAKNFFVMFASLCLSSLVVKKLASLGIFEQNYYSAKFITILIIGLLPIMFLFIPIAALAIGDSARDGKVRVPTASFLIAIMLFQSLELLSPFPKLWQSINSGWVQPNAQTTALVLNLPNDPKNPTVLFKFYPNDPGSTRLGDFWLGTYANPREPYQSWSYVGNQEGDMKGFCALNQGYQKMTVLTRDPSLSTRMFANCPEEEIDIEWVP